LDDDSRRDPILVSDGHRGCGKEVKCACLVESSTHRKELPEVSTDTATQQLKNWLAAYDGDDWNAYLAFVKRSFVAEREPMLRYPGFRNLTGGFSLRKVEAETPTQATVMIEERDTDQMARVVVEVEASEPHRILKLHPEPIPPSHLNEQEVVDRTRQLSERMTLADKFAGDVLIAKGGQAVFAQGYGLAEREHRIPNTLHARFGMASVSKMFTSVAILQLVEARKIKLDDPIGKYLTDYPNREVASKVTIRELLNHTGGTGDIFGPELDTHAHELRTHEDYIRLFGSRPPRFEPGSRFEYSNYGYVILGAVIDRVSGQSYYDYVQNHVYIPAGMTSTAMPEPGDKPVADLSVGYSKRRGTSWHSDRAAPQVRGTASGGGYTTVGDLLRFANALQDSKLLGAQYTELLKNGDIATPKGINYSYGFEVTTWDGLRCFGKSRLGPGTDDNFNICPAAGYVVAVLTNMDPPAGQRISGFILNRLPERQSAHQ
jgi:CubicO group peptidase (beta-lactamase class C family)